MTTSNKKTVRTGRKRPRRFWPPCWRSDVDGSSATTTTITTTTGSPSPDGDYADRARAMLTSSSSASLSPFSSSSIYPLTPRGSTVLVRYSSSPIDYTVKDKIVVICSSLFFVGGVFWVPALYGWLVHKYRQIPFEDKRRRWIYGTCLVTLTCLYFKGPHRHPTFGEKFTKVQKWKLWTSWMKFFAYEIVADNYENVRHLLSTSNDSGYDDGGGGGGGTTPDTAGSRSTGEVCDNNRLRQVILGM